MSDKIKDIRHEAKITQAQATGLDFFGLIEEFRQSLHKKVDLLRLDDIKENKDLLFDILKDGVKIYG